MFYSPSKNTWYLPESRTKYEATGSWPDDATEYSLETFIATVANCPADKRLVPGPDGQPTLVTPPAPLPTTEELCALVDQAADAARAAVAKDPLRAVEYDRARLDAEQFAAADYQGDVPPMVAAWAINGRTAQQAADDILHEAAQYTTALVQLRTVRLKAKELIRAAMAAGNIELAKAIAAETITTIETAVAGIGNND